MQGWFEHFLGKEKYFKERDLFIKSSTIGTTLRLFRLHCFVYVLFSGTAVCVYMNAKVA